VTREEAIKILEQFKVAEEDTVEKFAPLGVPTTTNKMLAEIYGMAISALREQPRWISVEDRLPEKDKDVLCYSNKNGGYMFFGYRGWMIEEWMEGGSLHIGNVTHWMPLPEAPKEEV